MEILNKDNKIVPIELKVSKPLEGRKFYISRLMKVLGRTYWQVNGVAQLWTEDMLSDALKYCEPYLNIKLRNKKFNEYKEDTKKLSTGNI